MGVAYNTSVVTNGLVLCLDAGNSRSYSGSGTTMSDISGFSNTASLLNGVGYTASDRGAFVFDGSNDAITVPDSDLLDIVADKSLSLWVRMGADTNGCGIAGKMTSTVNGMALTYGWSSGGINRGFQAIAWNSTNTPSLDKDSSRDIQKWVYLTAVQSGTTRQIYAWDNVGLRFNSVSGGNHTWNNNVVFCIGSASNLSNFVPANTRIALVSVYNRALSAAEIQQNFSALRGRFGI